MKIKKYLCGFALAISMFFSMSFANVKASLLEDMVDHVENGLPQIFEELRQRWPDGCSLMNLATEGYIDRAGMHFYACMAFAVNVYDELFKKFQDMEGARLDFSTTVIVDINEIQPGDVVMYNSGSEIMDHAIVITKVSGDDIYYVDCNGNLDCKCIVKWDNHISREELKKQLENKLVEVNAGKPGVIVQSAIVNFIAWCKSEHNI